MSNNSNKMDMININYFNMNMKGENNMNIMNNMNNSNLIENEKDIDNNIQKMREQEQKKSIMIEI